MILNAYAVLDAFIALLRLPFGLLVIALGTGAWWRSRRPASPETATAQEDRNYLLSLLALLLLVLNLVSWPLLYLLLQSYVAEWPGVMCIYGVTRIGAGSVGPSRFLPGLLAALQVLKPILVFVSGAWFVLYLLNRRTPTPLLGRTFLALIVCGALTVADAGIEMTYLLIPKKEETAWAGCCTGAFEDTSRTWGALTNAIGGPGARPWLYAAYYASNFFMVAALFAHVRRIRPPGPGLGLLLLGAVVALIAGGLFLVEVAAPTLLHLPYHHCPYDLVPRAPDALLGVALFLWGTCSVGWACVAGWFARCSETGPFLGHAVGGILFVALCCYLGSLIMMSVELALA